VAIEDDCGRDENVHEVSVNIEFVLDEGEDGSFEPRAAAISSHLHNVPPEAAAQTLVIIAHKIIGDHMAHTTFESCPSEVLKHAMGRAAAAALLIETLKNAPSPEDMISTIIPDDISELLGD